MMTFINWLGSFFVKISPSPALAVPLDKKREIDAVSCAEKINPPTEPVPALDPLPTWLANEEDLRDEGVLFGLSDTRPDTKIAQIRAFFDSQAALLTERAENYTEQIRVLSSRIDQWENRMVSLRNQLTQLREIQPASNTLVRQFVSLVISTALCIGTFYLVDDTLYRTFPNHWVSLGVFLAGLFNLFGRTSFFYEANSRLTGRRLLEEIGLPLASALFVLVHALPNQPVLQAAGLFLFILLVFLLSGKLLLSTLNTLQLELNNFQKNRQLLVTHGATIPLLESQLLQLEQETDTLNGQKLRLTTALNQLKSMLTQLNTRRDKLVNLFLGEFELARSLRDRLTNQQRALIMND